MKKTTIRKRIVRVSAVLMLIALGIVGIGASLISFSASVGQSQRAYTSIVSTATVAIEIEIDAIKGVVQELGMNTNLYDPEVSKDELTIYLKNKAEQYGYIAFYATDTQGIDNLGCDLSSYEFFQVAVRGETYFSEPMLTADGNTTHIMVAAPIWENGMRDSEVKGTVCAVIDGSLLSDLVSKMNIGESGSMYIINSEGYTIADADYNLVLNRENSILGAETDSSLKEFAEADSKALRGEGNFTTVIYNDMSQFLYVMPLGDTGWAIGGLAYAKEYVGSHLYVTIATVVASLVLLVVAYYVNSRFAWMVSRPVISMTEASRQIAGGNYNIDIQCDSRDELGDMAENFRKMSEDTKSIIEDTKLCLKGIADGDFTVSPSLDVEYPGVFLHIESALRVIAGTLGNVIRDIRETSEQVDASATQVAEAASSLSQGTTEQAAAVEQLAASVHQISEQVKENSFNSQTAHELVSTVRTGMEQGNEKMQRLNEAMHLISTQSGEITNIVKFIDDIAFQTNILALNAAIEAARAGQAGKGFTVVADEVRSLAAKCASSVQDITPLIESIREAIKEGAKIAEDTAEALRTVVEQTTQVASMMDAINDACRDQTDRLVETATGIEQISGVIQSNSAVAEQSAAASDELAGQATQLKKMLEKFKVK